MKIKKYIPLFLILVLGTAVRYYHNLDISLWHDEAFSAFMIRYPWSEMFYRLSLDVHPPAYYVFLRFWHYAFGDSLLSLRSFTVLFGTGSIWAGWLLTKEAFKSEKAALWAALFIAINPFQLLYATEARMYTMGTFFALLAGYFLVKALDFQKQLFEAKNTGMQNLPQNNRLQKFMAWSFTGFAISTAIMAYTHYYLIFTACALGFYGLVYLYFHHQGGPKKYLPAIISYIAVIVSFLPQVKTLLFQYQQVSSGYWIQPMDRWSIPATFWDMLIGFARDVSLGKTQVMISIVTLFSLYFLYRFLKRTQSFHKWMIILVIAAPFLGALLFAFISKIKGSNSSVFLDRYFLFAGVYFSIAFALWLKEISLKWLSVSLFLLYIALNLAAFVNFWHDLDIQTKPGMAAAAKFLNSNATKNDKIYSGISAVYFNFKYYNQTPVHPQLYTEGVIYTKDVPHYKGSALLNDDDLIPDFKVGTHSGDTVWLIWTNGFYSSKPEVPLNWTQVDERSWGEVRPLYTGIRIYVTEYKVN